MASEQIAVSQILCDIAGASTCISRADRREWVEMIYTQTRLRYFCDPLWIAVRLGLNVRPITDWERAPAEPAIDTLYYAWGLDGRAMGGRIYRGLAVKLLAGRDHQVADVHLLAAELAMPESAVRSISPAALAELHPFAPLWWMQARLAGLRPSGIMRAAIVSADLERKD